MAGIERIERDVVVLGAGPAGLAAALSSAALGADTLLVEREERLGGILRQCVHDGFGLRRFGEALTGPEYALRFSRQVPDSGVETMRGTFVHEVSRDPETGTYAITAVSPERGLLTIHAKSLVLATGCRERSDRQVLIHGDRPAGVFTAGLAQRLVNIEGLLPGRRAVILGSGDIGLIMARRLRLEGVEVEGVYEIKGEPSGLARNIAQCLVDFSIPLHLSTTVTEIHGRRRVESVTIAAVDERGSPIAGTERLVPCDTLILSVGLIPENEVLLSLGLGLDMATRGPRIDQSGRTGLPGLYACGNAVHVNNLVDDVSESGEIAGRAAARHAIGSTPAAPAAGGYLVDARQRLVPLKAASGFLYALPQLIDPLLAAEGAGDEGLVEIHFRSNATIKEGARVRLRAGERILAERRFVALRPPEAERLAFDPGAIGDAESLVLELERGPSEGGRK
ncbi:MAG TPA: FAD/NAD(P)-binding oxidoreductase [Rectinemataceae bacterium]|nr:FAD/NAD(P)-binding oxidoreductase [Rectinemataceae bacterium]